MRIFLGLSVIVGLGVGLSVGLSVELGRGVGGGIGVYLGYIVGPGVRIGVGLWDMMGVGMVRGVKNPPWMNLPVNTNTYTKSTKATKYIAINFRKDN